MDTVVYKTFKKEVRLRILALERSKHNLSEDYCNKNNVDQRIKALKQGLRLINSVHDFKYLH